MLDATEPLPASDAHELARALAQLASHGLPMAEGLRALSEDVPQRRMRRVLDDVAGALAGGASLESALVAQRQRLPAALLGVVRAGESAGQLGQLLEQYLLLESQAADLRRRMWLAMAYPLALAAFCLAVFSFVELVVAPSLIELTADATIIAGRGSGSNRLAELTISIARGYPAFLTGAILSGAILTLVFRWALSPGVRQRLLERVPLAGAAWRWTAWSHFCAIAALLTEHRTPLSDALRLAGEATGNANVRESAARMADDAAAGSKLTASPAARTRLPPSLLEMIAGGESQGALAEGLRAAARLAGARARMQAGLVLLVTPWLGFLAIAVLVVLCALVLFLPVATLFMYFI